MKLLLLLGSFGFAIRLLAAPDPAVDGYTDTPRLPGGAWRVHDAARPTPPEVAPGREVGAPPSDAVVLFDGTSLDRWTGDNGAPPAWTVTNGYAVVVPKKGGLTSRDSFGDCQLHIEWSAPPIEGAKNGQARGNSGVILMGLYEIQILDSYKNKTYADGQAAAAYGQHPPLVNVSRPPEEWQTYDIVFEAPRFTADGAVEKPAFVTVFHNGVLVQNHAEIYGPTAHRAVVKYKAHPPEGPLKLQNHGNPVRFRNIWIRRLNPAPATPRPAGLALSGPGDL
jgi:hypothetical protein